MRRVLWAILGGIALLGALTACRRIAEIGQEQRKALQASGIIQAEEVNVASEFGGQVLTITVSASDTVTKGQPLVQLDTTLLDAQIQAAQAMVAMAEAGLAQAQAGARPGQIAVAEAQLQQAEAGVQAARQSLSDTQSLVDWPQELDLQIAVTKAQLEAARHKEAQAIALKDAVELGKNRLDEARAKLGNGGRYKAHVSGGEVADLLNNIPPELRDILPPLPDIPDGDYTQGDFEVVIKNGHYDLYKWVNVSFPLEAQLLPNTWWQAWVGVNAATAQRKGLEKKLADLYAQRAQPQTLLSQAHTVSGTLAQMQAQAELARIQVQGLRNGLTEQDLAVFKAQVAQAHAALDALQQQREMMTITAPRDGTVLDLVIARGEVASPGATLLTLADLRDMSLTVYVPENRMGDVWPEQPVTVTVDSFPDRSFGGHVAYISDVAEFTPRNVATQEERENLVFAVRIRLDNQSGLLKPGMPADVTFAEAR